MKIMEISESAVILCAAWIEAVENALADCGNKELIKEPMKDVGRECSRHIFNYCRKILGKKPEFAGELLDAMNQRGLQKNGLSNVWKKQE